MLRASIKSFMLCAALASAVLSPLPAMADNVFVMVVNTRGADGIYRPALRVVRGGTVIYYRSDDPTAANPITAEILRDEAALRAWLAQNAGLTPEENNSIIIEQPPVAPIDTCIELTSNGGANNGMGQIILAQVVIDCCYDARAEQMPHAMGDVMLIEGRPCRPLGAIPRDDLTL